ncbi:MAG: hypothetical protein AAF805_14110 [Planctomycetota bacterium]
MSIFGMAVAAILLLAFLADLVIGVPFGGQSVLMDAAFLVAAALLGYMGFDAFRTSN